MAVAVQWPVGTSDPDSFTSNTIPFPAVPGGHYGDPRAGGRMHRGYDFTPIAGWGVRAVADGRVYFRPPYIDNGDAEYPSGYAAGGVQVWIQHDGFQSRYLHLIATSPNHNLDMPQTVADRPIYHGGQGQFVRRGESIGTVGGTNFAGAPYAPHLHLEIVLGNPGLANTGIDPIPFIRERLANGEPTPIERQNGDDMYLVKDKALGHHYLIGNQYIRHITGSNTVGNLRQAGVPFLEGNNGYTVVNIGTAMGIPMHVAYRESDGMIRSATSNNFGSGGLWTIERRLARLQGLNP